MPASMGAVIFLTDLADQAVVLPVVLIIALALAAQGWKRGGLAWLGAVGATFGVMLVLKLVFLGCPAVFGPLRIRSPSGHAAAAAIVCGGFAALRSARLPAVLASAGAAWVVIGSTRLLLGVHSLAEVMIGGLTGMIGAGLLSRLAGEPPARLRIWPVLAAVVVVAAALHGTRLPAERVIHEASRFLSGVLPACAAPLPEATNSASLPRP